MGNFDIRVMELRQRQELIRERAEAARKRNETEDFYAPNSETWRLPVITLDLDAPLYRLDNARTKSWQLSYIEEREEEIPPNFFDSNENLAAQKVQHERLLNLSKKVKGDDPSIYSILEDEGRQTQRLLITLDGVVLNGNRRLAAMRELAPQIEAFNKIKVLVLDQPLQKSDLLEIEARLQLAPDARLDYDWTDDALLIEDMRKNNINDERIAKALRKEKSEVQILVDQLNEGKLYLKECLGEPMAFERIVPHDEIFWQLTKALKKLSAADKDVARLLCWNIVKHGEDAERRLYDYRILFSDADKREQTLSEFAKRAKIPINGTANTQTEASNDDDLFEDEGEQRDTAADKYADVLAVLKDQEKSKQAAAVLRDIGDDLIELKNADKAKNMALNKIKRAQMLLDGITLENADPASFGEMLQTLDLIASAAEKIRNNAEKMRSNGEKHAINA